MIWGEPRITADVDSYLATQHWFLTCRPRPAGWESTCVCFPAERRETVSDPSGRWISSLQLPVSTGQQTAVPPGSRQVQDHQATKHLHTSTSTLTLHIPDVTAFFWIWAKLLQSVFFFRNMKLHLFKGLRKASNKANLVTKQFKWGVPSVIITVLTSGTQVFVCVWGENRLCRISYQTTVAFVWSLLTRPRSAQIKVKCAWKGKLRGTASLLKFHLPFSSQLCILVLACIAAVPVLPPSWLQWGLR